MKVVCQKKLNCEFSMQKRQPCSVAHWTSLAVKKYNLFAFETFMRSTNKRLGNPLGCLSDRSGLGSPGAPCGFPFQQYRPPSGSRTTSRCYENTHKMLTCQPLHWQVDTNICSKVCNDHLCSSLLVSKVICTKCTDHAKLTKLSCYSGRPCKYFNYHAIWDIPSSTSQCADAALASLLFVVVFLSMGGKTALAATKVPSF